jgi:polysaccharide deacetylase family protein (PEP-CTERM system associated)
MWALEILAEEGFRVDSSIFPIRHDRYGVPGAQETIHTIDTAAGPLIEFPPSVFKLSRARLPISGGGYFRLYPGGFSTYALRSVNRCGEPFMFYIHPWEVDPNQPRLRHGSYLTRFRHYVGLAATEQKLVQLLAQFRFGRLSDVLDASFTQSRTPSRQTVDGAAVLEHT